MIEESRATMQLTRGPRGSVRMGERAAEWYVTPQTAARGTLSERKL